MDLSRRTTIAFGASLCWASCAFAGDVEGLVQVNGPVPEATMVTIEAKSNEYPIEGCGERTKPSQRLLVDASGGLQNAVVWLDGLQERGPTLQRYVLDQQACMFVPHVLVVPKGAELVIRTSDPVVHNVRIFDGRTMLMHEWQKPHSGELAWTFEQPGRYLVRCGVHQWMHAWVIVAEHQYYAISDQAGRFTIPDVPDGTYVMRVWHETLGETQQPLKVRGALAGVTIRINGERGKT